MIALGALALAACGDGSGGSELIYPPALRPTPGINISSWTSGCPNFDQVDEGELTVDEALDVLNVFVSPDSEARRQASDPAFWVLLSDVAVGDEPLSPDRIEVGAAADAPHAEPFEAACGEHAVRLSGWVQLCPGPCEAAAGSQSLISHWYLIERQGRWLVWAAD